MQSDLLERAGIDYHEGVHRFKGRAALYEKVLAKFPKDTTFDRIRADYDADDMEKMLRDAHEFKGMCGNIAMTRLFRAADTLVNMLRADAFSRAELDGAYAAVENAYHAAYDAVIAAMEEPT